MLGQIRKSPIFRGFTIPSGIQEYRNDASPPVHLIREGVCANEGLMNKCEL